MAKKKKKLKIRRPPPSKKVTGGPVRRTKPRDAVQEALELCDRIIEMIEEEVPTYAWDKAESFFTDINDKVRDMRSRIAEDYEVSERQREALENWAAGVGKWIRD